MGNHVLDYGIVHNERGGHKRTIIDRTCYYAEIIIVDILQFNVIGERPIERVYPIHCVEYWAFIIALKIILNIASGDKFHIKTSRGC